MRPLWIIAATAIFLLGLAGCNAAQPEGEVKELRIPRGAGGVGFLPLMVMEKYQLVENNAKAAGIADLKVQWIDLGGPSVMNEALLSGSVDFIAAGPPAFITLWDRTRDSAKVMGVAAITSLPMYLNTRSDHLKSLEDFTDQDKIAVTAIKVSIPALVMQMYARDKHGASEVTRFDKYTVTMTHPDGLVALLAGSGAISAHFTSPPFHQRERKDPRVRTIMNSDEVLGGSTTFTMLSTTSRFREQSPLIYNAVLKALDEAIDIIVTDKDDAAQLLLSTTERGFSAEELAEVVKDPSVKFTTIPENVMKYAEFMHSTGSIKNRPGSWKDMFFSEIHESPGS
jgi:NitT/TauT family transport system substrate-binding protein